MGPSSTIIRQRIRSALHHEAINLLRSTQERGRNLTRKAVLLRRAPLDALVET